MSDLRTDLDATLARVWTRLLAAPRDKACPFRTPALATAGGAGAEARLVVLRAARQDPPQLEFHTDAASAKVSELAAAPRATLLFWDPGEQFQVRVRAYLTARAGTPEEWMQIPDPARRAYGGTPPPGTVIGNPTEHHAVPEPDRHMIIAAEVAEIETLLIDAPPHVRARFRASDGFRGDWLAP